MSFAVKSRCCTYFIRSITHFQVHKGNPIGSSLDSNPIQYQIQGSGITVLLWHQQRFCQLIGHMPEMHKIKATIVNSNCCLWFFSCESYKYHRIGAKSLAFCWRLQHFKRASSRSPATANLEKFPAIYGTIIKL